MALAILFLASSHAAGTTYYLSAQQGSHDQGGRAQDFSGERTSILRSLSALSNTVLRGGDKVLLRCGERYTGPVKLRIQGHINSPVLIGAFGSCEASSPPIIDGRIPYVNQSLEAGVVHHFTEGRSVALLYTGNQPLANAVFPENAWMILEKEGSSVSRLPDEIKGVVPGPLDNATLIARTQEWWVDRALVLKDLQSLDSTLRYPLRRGAGVRFMGKSWMVKPGSDTYAVDQSLGRLSVSTSKLSVSAPLQVVERGPLIDISGQGSIHLRGIHLFAAGGDALRIHVDGDAELTSLGVEHALGNAISVTGARTATVQRSSIRLTGLDAIFFAEVGHAIVRDVSIADAGMFDAPQAALAAINAHRTRGALIEGNVVENSAYIGIRFSGDANVRNNIIAGACRRLTDCGGLYTWRRNNQDVRPRTLIENNLVFDIAGDTSVKFNHNEWLVGVYADDFSNDVVIANNIVADTTFGIVLKGWNNIARSNILSTRSLPFFIKQDQLPEANAFIRPPVLSANRVSNRLQIQTTRTGTRTILPSGYPVVEPSFKVNTRSNAITCSPWIARPTDPALPPRALICE
jgi:hypothetical protein